MIGSTNRAILKLNSNELHFVRHNIDLEITQQVAPSIFSFQENISKSLIYVYMNFALPELHSNSQLNKLVRFNS